MEVTQSSVKGARMRHCPICHSTLESRPVAPCFDCGHVESELVELAAREHTYHEFRAFGYKIIHCNFCDADFGSYYPSYFGLPDRGKLIGEVLDFVREIGPIAVPDYRWLLRDMPASTGIPEVSRGGS